MQSHYEYTLTGEVREVEDQVVLLCNEFPVSGIGNNSEEAFADLLHAFRTYTEGTGDVDILTTEHHFSDSGPDTGAAIPQFHYSMNRGGPRHLVAS